MSVVLEKDNFTITDSLGNTKFSLDRRIPHIIYNLPGVVPIPTILGANPNASAVERTDEIVLINNSLINTNDYFILNSAGTRIIAGSSASYVDSPNTTSSTTYKIQIKAESGSTAIIFANSTITVLEIKG